MMKTYSAPKAIFAAIGMALLITSCGISSGSNGDDEAALSCVEDLEAGIINARIVSTGMRSDALVKPYLEDIRKRAILSAQAAALNTYWQPLADAWALNEALIQTIVDGGLSPSTSEGYIQFKQNVNLNYASISKDTYCRIAFSKKGIAIDYEAVQK
jgi:hypothetical protein